MPRKLKLAVCHHHTLESTAATLAALEATVRDAARAGVDLMLFPEAYLGGYPTTCAFGSVVCSSTPAGREQFLRYFRSAVDLGDTPAGAGDDWLARRLPVAEGAGCGGGGGGGGGGALYRGDGTREELERIARETGVFIVVSLIERSGGSLYCAALYVCPREGVLGKRRKVMPTAAERLIWAQGSPSTLRAVTTTIAGTKLTLAAAICWENYMPLLRHSLYSQNVNLYLAPSADGSDTWLPLMRTIACEGRAFVMSSAQRMRRRDLPRWIHDPSSAFLGDDSSGANNNNGSSNSSGSGGDVGGNAKQPSSSLSSTTGKKARSADQEADSTASNATPEHGTEQTNAGASASGDAGVATSDGGGGDAEPLSAVSVVSFDGNGDETPGTPPFSRRPRRKSTITRTEENHEIVWPDVSADSGADASRHEKEHEQTQEEEKRTANVGRGSDGGGGAGRHDDGKSDDDVVLEGGSCIISPEGKVLAGPLWSDEGKGWITADVDFDDCIRGRLELDVAGSYSRNDAFKLTVEGLDINPPA